MKCTIHGAEREEIYMKIWSLKCENECIYAVVFADTLQLAIKKVRKETSSTSEWIGEEWGENKYGGVLIFS